MRSRYLLTVLIGAGLALMLSLPSPAEEAPNKEQIDKLIDQLGSGVFAEREKASKELAAIGVPVLEALRKAAKSDDAEVRKRAEELIPKIERQAESLRVLAPKRLHLVYKDTPLTEAVADFQKKSGYSIHLHDPEGKLKERKIALDTGATTFWHALELFCAKAELTEASMEDLLQVPRPPGVVPGGAPAPLALPRAVPIRMPGRRGMPGMSDQIILKDGKANKRPADDRSAVRVRVLSKSDLSGNAPDGEIILPLEVTLEPKLQWQNLQSIRVEKAVDDRGQKLAQVIPQVEGGGNMAIALPGGGVVFQQGNGGYLMLGGGLRQQFPIQLKKGGKAAKSLKELKGVLTAQLLTEARPVIVADKLKAGETFKGEEGGSLKIVEVKSEEGHTTLRVELEPPPLDKVVPAQQTPAMGGFGAPIRVPRAGKMLPAPVIQQGGRVAIAVNATFVGSISGLSIQDDKGNALPIRAGQTQLRVMQQANGMQTRNMTFTLSCLHDKDKGQPAKVVYLGSKRATVDVPFTLTNVPLP